MLTTLEIINYLFNEDLIIEASKNYKKLQIFINCFVNIDQEHEHEHGC